MGGLPQKGPILKKKPNLPQLGGIAGVTSGSLGTQIGGLPQKAVVNTAPTIKPSANVKTQPTQANIPQNIPVIDNTSPTNIPGVGLQGINPTSTMGINKEVIKPGAGYDISQPTQTSITDNQIDYKQSLADLDATIQSNPNITPEEISKKFPEFVGMEQSLADLDATIQANPNITPEEIDQKFPEFRGMAQPIQTDQGIVGGLKSKLSQIGSDTLGDWGKWERLNPVGKTVEEVDNAIQKIPTMSVEKWDKFAKEKLGGFGEGMGALPTMVVNALPSLLKTATGMARGVTNPLDTVAGISKIFGTQEGRQILKDNYGSWEGLGKQMTENPVGLATDILSIVEGGAGLASKGAKLAGMAKTSAKLGEISKIAGSAGNLGMERLVPGLEKLSTTLPKPLQTASKIALAPTQPFKVAGEIVKDITPSIPGKVSMIDQGINKFISEKTGIRTDNIEILRNDPEIAAIARKSYEEGITTQNVMDKIVNTMDSLDDSLESVGSKYTTVKSRGETIKGSDIYDKATAYLESKGIAINEKGKLVTNKPIPKTELNNLQQSFDFIQKRKNELLDMDNTHEIRQGIDKLVYDKNTRTRSKIGEDMRRIVDEEIKQKPGMKIVDEEYNKLIKQKNQLKQDFFEIDQNTGEMRLKANAPTTIKNLLKPQNRYKLEALEKQIPGITKQLQALSVLQDLEMSMNIPTRSRIRDVGAGASVGAEIGHKIIPVLGAPVGAVVGAGAGFLKSLIYNPENVFKYITEYANKGGDFKNIKTVDDLETLVGKSANFENTLKNTIETADRNKKAVSDIISKDQSQMKLPGPNTVTPSNLGTPKNPIVGKDLSNKISKNVDNNITTTNTISANQKSVGLNPIKRLGEPYTVNEYGRGSTKYLDIIDETGKRTRIKADGVDWKQYPQAEGGGLKAKAPEQTPKPTEPIDDFDELIKQKTPTTESKTSTISQKQRGGAETIAKELGYESYIDTPFETRQQIDTLVRMRNTDKYDELFNKLKNKKQPLPNKNNPLVKNKIEKKKAPLQERINNTVTVKPEKVVKAPEEPLIAEARKYKSAEEFVKAKMYEPPKYGMSHRPTFEGSPPAHNLLEGDMLPRDVYSKPEWSIASMGMKDPYVKESREALQKIKGNPEAEITIYRASPKNELNIGDWVSFSKKYAEGEGIAEGSKAYAYKVKAKDIYFAGDDINEFGYFPKDKLKQIREEANSKGLPMKEKINQPVARVKAPEEFMQDIAINQENKLRELLVKLGKENKVNPFMIDDYIKMFKEKNVGENVSKKIMNIREEANSKGLKPKK